MVDSYLWIVLEWTISIPVEGSQLEILVSSSGVSPSSIHRARSLGKLTDHVDSSDGFVRKVGRVSDTLHLFKEIRARVFFGQVVCNIKSYIKALFSNVFGNFLGNPLDCSVDSLNKLVFEVLPDLSVKFWHVFLHKFSLDESSVIVGVSPDMND